MQVDGSDDTVLFHMLTGLIMQVSILLLTPYFSKIVLSFQLQPQEFITGLLIKHFLTRLIYRGGHNFFLPLTSEQWSYFPFSNRFSYVLLYANYIVKWCSTYSGCSQILSYLSFLTKLRRVCGIKELFIILMCSLLEEIRHSL